VRLPREHEYHHVEVTSVCRCSARE
jgi:hypothetical protein